VMTNSVDEVGAEVIQGAKHPEMRVLHCTFKGFIFAVGLDDANS
jgi:hypothetical protein